MYRSVEPAPGVFDIFVQNVSYSHHLPEHHRSDHIIDNRGCCGKHKQGYNQIEAEIDFHVEFDLSQFFAGILVTQASFHQIDDD